MDFFTSVAISGVILIVGGVYSFGFFSLMCVPVFLGMWAYHGFSMPEVDTLEGEVEDEWGLKVIYGLIEIFTVCILGTFAFLFWGALISVIF